MMARHEELMARYREALAHFEKEELIEMHITLHKMMLNSQKLFFQHHKLVRKLDWLIRMKNFKKASGLSAKLSDAPVQEPKAFIEDIEATISDVQRERRQAIQLEPCSAAGDDP